MNCLQNMNNYTFLFSLVSQNSSKIMHYVFGCFPTHNINDGQFFTKHDLLTDSFQHFIVDPIRSDFYCVVISFKRQNAPSWAHTLWNRKGTQWATWGLIWSLWVSKGLKWTHFEWPYFAVAKLGLNLSQSVLFWMATTKLHPHWAQMVSFWVTPSCKG